MFLEHRIFFSQAKLAKRSDNSRPTATFTISVNNLITTDKKFRSIIHKINKTFSACDFMLCDTLNRYNIRMDVADITELQASEVAYEQGNIWLKENQKYLDELTIPHKLIRWGFWINNPGFAAKLQQVADGFERNLSYKEAFYNTAALYLSRRNLSGDSHLRMCIEYLKEECAVMLLWADAGYHFELYPAKRNQAMEKTFEIFIKEQFGNAVLLPVKIDVKYKRKREHEIANSALQSLLGLTSGHVYVKDKEGYYLFCNDAQAKSLGLTVIEVIGKTDYELSNIDKANQYRETDLFVMSSGKPNFVEERAFYSNKYSTFLSTKSPLYGENGELIGIVGISFDVTDRKEKEKLMLENREYRAREKLQHEFKTIVDQVAHDIRSPLASLYMIVETCKGLSKTERELFGQPYQRILDIANNLLKYFKLDFSRGIGEVTHERLQPVLLPAVLFEIIAEKKYEYALQQIEFIINCSDYFVFVNIDSQALKRSLSNLINNAVDALPNKSGIITVSLNAMVNKAQVIVEDNGVGMPEAIQKKILNNLSVTAGKVGGHGIGFSQVRSMLAENNGTLSIQSKPAQGTKIILGFQMADVPEWITQKLEFSTDDVIIILDDNISVHETWEIYLQESAPHNKRKYFQHGASALSYINSLTVAEKEHVCLFTEYKLSDQDMDGLDVAIQAKAHCAVLVTNQYDDEKIIGLARQANHKVLPKILIPYIPINRVHPA